MKAGGKFAQQIEAKGKARYVVGRSLGGEEATADRVVCETSPMKRLEAA